MKFLKKFLIFVWFPFLHFSSSPSPSSLPSPSTSPLPSAFHFLLPPLPFLCLLPTTYSPNFVLFLNKYSSFLHRKKISQFNASRELISKSGICRMEGWRGLTLSWAKPKKWLIIHSLNQMHLDCLTSFGRHRKILKHDLSLWGI